MDSQHNISSMSIACLEELQASRDISSIQQQEEGFSPLKHQSFNLSLKIKAEPKMAASLDKESPPAAARFQNDQDLKFHHHQSQDLGNQMQTSQRGICSFLQRFNHSESKPMNQEADDLTMRIVDQGSRDQLSAIGRDRKNHKNMGGKSHNEAVFMATEQEQEPQVLSQLTNKYDSQHPIYSSQQPSAKGAQAIHTTPRRTFDFGGN